MYETTPLRLTPMVARTSYTEALRLDPSGRPVWRRCEDDSGRCVTPSDPRAEALRAQAGYVAEWQRDPDNADVVGWAITWESDDDSLGAPLLRVVWHVEDPADVDVAAADEVAWPAVDAPAYTDGNIFAVLGTARKAARSAGLPYDAIQALTELVTRQPSYDAALGVIFSHIS